jgi:hypothetical protein
MVKRLEIAPEVTHIGSGYPQPVGNPCARRERENDTAYYPDIDLIASLIDGHSVMTHRDGRLYGGERQ